MNPELRLEKMLSYIDEMSMTCCKVPFALPVHVGKQEHFHAAANLHQEISLELVVARPDSNTSGTICSQHGSAYLQDGKF